MRLVCCYCIQHEGPRINESGKGDHKHVRGREVKYRFVSVERLVADFFEDVKRWQDKTVTIDIRPLADTLGDFTQTWKSGKASAPRISF